MLKRFDYKKKNIAMIAMMVIFTYVGWVFSFKKTIQAVALNTKLNEELSNGASGNNFAALQRKHDFYNQVIKSYRIKGEDSEGKVWQGLSNIAIGSGIDISYDSRPVSETDSVLIKQHIKTINFNFQAEYHDMVKLLDTVSRSSFVGRPSGFLLKRNIKNGDEANKRLRLKLSMSGISQ